MTPPYMLDTDAASYVIKGPTDEIRPRLERTSSERLCISVLSQAELLYSLQRLAPEHRLDLLVRRFLAGIRVLPWPADAADHDASIRHALTMSGRLIGEFDMLSAAHSIAAGAVPVTNNRRHFGRIAAPLALQAWADF